MTHETDSQKERRLAREATTTIARLGPEDGENCVILEVTYWDTATDYERAGRIIARCNGNPWIESEALADAYFRRKGLSYQIVFSTLP